MNSTIASVSPPAAGSTALPAAPLPGQAGSHAAVLPQPPPPPAQSASSPPPQLSADAARQAARAINDFIKSTSANVEFTVDSESDQVVVRVVDSENNQLIRQIPSEDMLAISHALDRMTGLLFKQKA
jgi:flagellar protein FlaG